MMIGGVPVPLQAQVMLSPPNPQIGTYVYARWEPPFPNFVDQQTGQYYELLSSDPNADYAIGGRCDSDAGPGFGIVRLFNGQFQVCQAGPAGTGRVAESSILRVFA